MFTNFDRTPSIVGKKGNFQNMYYKNVLETI